MGWDDKIQLKVKTLIGNIIFIAALLLITTRFLMIWTGGSFPVNLVSSDSMSPTLGEGDIVAWTPAKIEDIEKGDVIVFKSYVHWPEEKLVVHRVTDIKKDSFGDTILETKGDANKYKDQAGPHIPEPYIREDHLMGKTISIDKTPVKIPFIGKIGIWINQGIEQLSQPSTSKGTLSHIGIFTPMIASIIVLILLFFTIPEKNNTPKEKIKFNIFGPKKISLKKTFMVFIITYIAFFTIIHAFAYDSLDASIGVEAKSPDSSFNLGRIEKGQETFTKQLPVTNPSITKVKGIAFGTEELKGYVQEETFELEPGKDQTVTIKASASEKAEKGSYEGKIMVYSSPFWTMYSNDQIKSIYQYNPDLVILILDATTSLILTIITVIILSAITIFESQYIIWSTNRSRYHPQKTLIKKHQAEKIIQIKGDAKETFTKKIGWYFKLNLLEEKIEKINAKNITKPLAASLIVIPILFYINNQITAVIISGVLSGVVAFLISCKLRKKIVLSSITSIIILTIIIIYTQSMYIADIEVEILNIFTSVTGTIGLYMLFIGFLMIPLPLIAWFLSSLIRNVNERRKPLLMLERKCDL